jgi:hypothetical protein
VAVDFVYSHPAGRAQHPLVADDAKRHSNLAEARKMQTDGPPCETKGWGFSPFALSTWGVLGGASQNRGGNPHPFPPAPCRPLLLGYLKFMTPNEKMLSLISSFRWYVFHFTGQRDTTPWTLRERNYLSEPNE